MGDRHRRLDPFRLLATMLLVGATSIAPMPSPPTPSAPAPWEPELPHVDLPTSRDEFGVASWYGEWHHGKETANGEAFDQWALTAAHRTLPLGSYVDVTNVANGQQVRVRVNDRGPYIGGRVLDLSRGAAQRIGQLGAGLFHVRIRVIDEPAAIAASSATRESRVRRAAAVGSKPPSVSRASSRSAQ
jgi:rare lipoprotein A